MKGLRQKLVSTLRNKGIRDEKVLNAIGTIPRHLFLDAAFSDWAYKDQAFPIESDQTISQPFTVARQTELLEVKRRDKILEIGTGSGYQSCVLSEMGAKVYSIERQDKLFYKTNRLLEQIGYSKIRTLLGDGFSGSERFAPFDKILVTCACPYIPMNLVGQLKKGGIMVVPVGDAEETQKMLKIYKKGEQLLIKDFGQYRFVPMLQGVTS
ncbi:UNVERIFIED_CONTAM: hypothetical protein GTU68_021496 [Idotea baltica]|nr:hypothetical protein [Idotea baltica]